MSSNRTIANGEKKVMFFDIDNCLYHKNSGIEKHMKIRIYAYGKQIGIPEDKVVNLIESYNKDYGLAIRGYVLHHEVDPVEYGNPFRFNVATINRNK
ncbi:hypothetical protein AYI69_g2750 [Smittium culicis]|uniref:Suppressor of disruption of TFIIS n=1 Tax=Smittium culicis TaxID=133412 RepID=A0A1R1YLN8_9FUNG|nr:hypothetical protein AYI69_g2750 [Smittium culicis]